MRRLSSVSADTPQQAHDLRVFAAANYTGPSIRRRQPGEQFAVMAEIIETIAAMNGLNPPVPEVMGLIIEAVIENYGHFRPEEIKLALTSALMGRIEGAPKTFAKVNLEWIGGVLSAYEIARTNSIMRAKKRLPELPEKTADTAKAEVEADFWAHIVRIYNSHEIQDEDGRLLPQMFDDLDKWLRSHDMTGACLSDKRKQEIWELAEDILLKRDAREFEYTATKHDFFNAQMEKLSKLNRMVGRRIRLAKEICCRELIIEMKAKGIELQ